MISQLKIRLPDDVKDWLSEEARRNGASQNSEVIRALRARMPDARHPDLHPNRGTRA